MKFRRNRRFSIHTQHQYICKDNANSRTRTPLTLYFIEWILGKFLKQRVQNWTTTTTKPTNRAVVCGISTFGNNHKNFKVPNYRFNERMKKWEKTRLKTFENSSACETVCLCVLYMKFSFLLSFADCIWFEVKWLFYAFVFCVLFFFFFFWLTVVVGAAAVVGVFLCSLECRVLCILNIWKKHITNIHVPMVRALMCLSLCVYGRCWRRIMLTSFIDFTKKNWVFRCSWR